MLEWPRSPHAPTNNTTGSCRATTAASMDPTAHHSCGSYETRRVRYIRRQRARKPLDFASVSELEHRPFSRSIVTVLLVVACCLVASACSLLRPHASSTGTAGSAPEVK